MSARIVRNETWDRLAIVSRIMGKALADDAKRDLDRRMEREVLDPIVRVVGRAADSKQAKLAAGSVRAKTGAKPGLSGGDNSPGGALFYGSEFGGRGPKRMKSYWSKSKLGRRYKINNRHTTQQFRKHKGREGYWFTPAILGETEWAMGQMADMIEDTIAREL